MNTSTPMPAAPGAASPASKPAFGSASRPAQTSRRVVDAPTRMFHWLFALSFLGAYLTGDGERLRLLHVVLGYTMAGLLTFRVVYGLIGPKHARLSLLWRRLVGWPQWLKSFTLGGAAGSTAGGGLGSVNWRQGQNLIMALAVAALLVLVVPLTLSGYAAFHEWGDFLGDDWVADLHEAVGEIFLWVVLGHLALIAVLSVLRRRNQALPMFTGRTQGPGPALVRNNHLGLAALVLVAVLGYWSWEWLQTPNGLISAQALSDFASGREDDDD